MSFTNPKSIRIPERLQPWAEYQTTVGGKTFAGYVLGLIDADMEAAQPFKDPAYMGWLEERRAAAE